MKIGAEKGAQDLMLQKFRYRKVRPFGVAIIFALIAISGCVSSAKEPAESGKGAILAELTNVEICFSPGGGCREKIIEQIDSAKRSIDVAIYSFTNRELSSALVGLEKGNYSQGYLRQFQFRRKIQQNTIHRRFGDTRRLRRERRIYAPQIRRFRRQNGYHGKL